MTNIEISAARRWVMGVAVCVAFINWGLILSLQPAFYPTEAESKGATPKQYGFVFGIVSLAAFLFSPVFAQYANAIGAKMLYNTGGFTQGIAAILFGFLEFVDNASWFIGISYLLRFLEGVASAACTASIVGILMQLFPAYTSSITAVTEGCLGLGYMLGPVVGSAFYSLGGFGLPFFVVGSTGVVLAALLFFLVPNVKNEVRDNKNAERDGDQPSLTLIDVFKKPLLLLPYVDNFVVFCGNGMVESMLEPYMKDYANATQIQVSLTFLILGGSYMITTPFVGYVSDKIRFPVLFSIAGNVLMTISFLFLGPQPWINIQPSVPLIFGMVSCTGIGYACVMVSSFGRAHRLAIAKGFADDLGTSLVTSALWAGSFNLGNFVGPTASGFLVEAYGFRSSTQVFIGVYIIMGVIDTIDFFYNWGKAKSAKEYEQFE